MEVPAFPPNVLPQWATFVSGRKPRFKMHKDRGQAMNAIMYTVGSHPRGGVIYQFVDGDWKVFYTYEYDETCVECGVKGEIRKGNVRNIDGLLSVVSTWRTTRSGRKTSIPVRLQKTCHYGCKEIYKTKHPDESEWQWPSDDSRFGLNMSSTPTTP